MSPGLETPWRQRLRRLYRAVVDGLEAISVAHADVLLVNSKFTGRVVEGVFPRATRVRKPSVLYPPIPTSTETAAEDKSLETYSKRPFLLCISRFERKKNLELAIQALALLRADAQIRQKKLMLVIAGGYDERLVENVTYFAHLQSIVQEHDLSDDVHFALNVSDATRDALLRRCLAVVYTPSYEHFGIVPLEAMRVGKPVVACDSGGPRETIVDGVTGSLCSEPVTPAAFAKALQSLILDEEKRRRFGHRAAERAQNCFSRAAFGDRLVELLQLRPKESLKTL
jgi:alpha-1,3/alpha-1,6-mannosyltransferase